MNEIATEFPEKLLMFSPIGKRTYDMVLFGDQKYYCDPPRTLLPVKTTSKFLRVNLQCHVSNAYLLKSIYVRLGAEAVSKDLLESARISVNVEGDEVLNEVGLEIQAGEEKRYPLGFHRAGETQFFAFPFTEKEFSTKEAHGLFLPNGSFVKVEVTRIGEDVPLEIGLVMAEYRGLWKPTPA